MQIFLKRICIVVLFYAPGIAKAVPGSLDDSLKIKIVTFGNSITATRKTVDQVFAQRLPGLLKEQGIIAEVINSGIPGSHTGSVRDHNLFKIRHARDRLETDVLAHHPDLVTIGFGTNDAHIDSKVEGAPSRIPLGLFRENLVFMIKVLRLYQARVILITPNILGEKYGPVQNERLEEYVKVMRKLAKKFRLGLVDNFKSFSEYKARGERELEELLLDGVHPNDKGHTIIAENISREILKIYRHNEIKRYTGN